MANTALLSPAVSLSFHPPSEPPPRVRPFAYTPFSFASALALVVSLPRLALLLLLLLSSSRRRAWTKGWRALWKIRREKSNEIHRADASSRQENNNVAVEY